MSMSSVSGKIRIIETSYPLGGQSKHVYVFCLPDSLRERGWNEVTPALVASDGPRGVLQVVNDEAGVQVYLDEERSSGQRLCRDVTLLINDVLGTSLEYDPATSRCWYVADYNRGSFAKLMTDPSFRLPYLG